MAINQNRNSTRVLRATAVGYLVHENIPNLSIGTGSDFTIQLWVVKGKDTDGVLYSQEGGFSIQLVDGQAVFSLDGFATLSAGTDWKLSAHRQDYIAVRYESGTLALFLGGLKTAEKSVSTTVSACDGDYAIGKQFTGGFSLIRVSDTARSDQELLSDNAAMPDVDDHCVFQSDCSGVQYKDVSSNHLSMWAEGEGAGCGIYTACTVFSGKGQVHCAPAESLNATHTLLLKLWPQDQQKTQRVYTAMDGAKTMYAVELIPQDDHTFQLSIVNGDGGAATMSKALLPELWQDVAAVFDGGNVKLYLDGTLDGEYSFSFSGSRSDILVGSEYETGKPSYEKGFSGYIAYTAEFGKTLSPDDIALYADDPPFLFEDGLTSLLPLDWPDEVEAVGATALSVTGSAPFQLVADITPRDGDIGCSMRIPTEASPDWNQLSADEQWALELLARVMREELADLCGCSFDNSENGTEVPICQRITKPFKRYNKYPYERIRYSSPAPSEYRSTAEGITLHIRGRGNVPIARGSAGAGVTAAGAGGVSGFVSSHAGAVVGTVAVAVVAIAAVVSIIAIAEGDRPSDSTGALQVTGICWNHQGNPAKGGLHYHKGGTDLPASMTDTPGATRLDTLCVLVPSKLESPTVDVTLTYTTTGTDSKSGTLKAYDLTPGGLLGEQSVAYNVGPNASVTVSLPFDPSKLPTDAFQKLTHTWQFRDGNSQLTNCVCTLYLLPDAPISPWTVGSGTDYQTGEGGYVRTELLDFFAENSQGETEDVPKLCVTALNGCGYFQYDRAGGWAYYSLWDANTPAFLLKLEKLVGHLQAGSHAINCVDCACIVSAGCAMAGVSLPMARLWGDIASTGGFACNLMVAIGYSDWATPFESSNVFFFHQFNVNGSTLTTTIPVYDACLQVDGGDYPGGSDTSKKTPLLPLGLTAQETADTTVHVSTSQPYTGQFYRERLAQDGQTCQLAGPLFHLSGFSTDVSARRSGAPLLPALRAIWERFSLGALSQVADVAPLEGWDAAPLAGAAANEWAAGYGDWTLETGEGQVWVERRYCATAEETARHMAGVLFNVAHPNVRAGEAEGVSVGERCFLLGAGGILFCRRGNVFTVGGPSLDAALAVAKKLDESVQAS